MGKYGTNLEGFGAFEGGVNADKGAPLISTNSAGSSAIIFGSVALREMEAGVANGDFQIPPDEASSAISSDNPLPYFSTSDSSSGRITLALADSTAAPGTNLLRYTITSGLNADSFYVERIVPIVSSEARSFNYQAHAAIAAATSSANYTFTISAQYLQSDGTTVTGTEGSLAKTGADISSTIASLGFSYEMAADPNEGAPAPANAYYLRLRFTISLTGSVSSANFDLAELRVDHGVQNIMFADQASPDQYGYGQISLYTGGLIMEPNRVGYDRSNPTLILDSLSGDTQIDSSIRQSNPITLTNVIEDASTATYYATNTYQVGELVTVSGVTPSLFNVTNQAVTASSASSFTTAGITPAASTSVTGISVEDANSVAVNLGSIRLMGSFSAANFPVAGNVSYTGALARIKVTKGTITSRFPTSGTATDIVVTGFVPTYQVTAITYISASSATFTVPGHTFVAADKVYTNNCPGARGLRYNSTPSGASNFTVASVSGDNVTITNASSNFTTTVTPLTSDSFMCLAGTVANQVGTVYKNTAYTSGGTVKAPYPFSGNVELIHSGNNGSIIVKTGLVSGSPGTTSNLRFLSSTGPRIQGGGTNSRLMTTTGFDLAASTSSTSPGVLITKSTAGQPTTTLNGSGTTDAFSDALRNGGLAVDSTNLRIYAYTGGAWRYANTTSPSDSRLKEEITEISGALDTLRQLMPVAFRWKRPEAHQRADAVDDNGQRLGFIADQVATTDLKHWVEDMGVGDLEADLIDTDGRVLGVNIPQNEMEALVVQALLDIDARLKALESR